MRAAPVRRGAVGDQGRQTMTKELWQMTLGEFFQDADLVRRHVADNPGWSVSHAYTEPGPAGPTRGHMVLDHKPKKGDVIDAPFGKAKVTAVSKAKPAMLDNQQLRDGGKKAHQVAVA